MRINPSAANDSQQVNEAAKHSDSVSGMDNELDQTDFLQLLVAQLQYQDPMDPMDDRDFIAQMAQFSTLSQMQTLVRHQMTTLGAGLLGQDLAMETAEGDRIEGHIESIRWSDDELIVSTDDGSTVSMSEVTSVQRLDETEGDRNGESE